MRTDPPSQPSGTRPSYDADAQAHRPPPADGPPPQCDSSFDPHTYATRYVRLQQLFNGTRPPLAQTPWSRHAEGVVPYWDVPERVALERAGIERLGAPGPFAPEPGTVRVYSHYLNTREQETFHRAFQRPTGHLPALMTSSYRTLLLLPDGSPPFMLKFDGQESTPLDGPRTLTRDDAEVSIAHTAALRALPYVIPEASALSSALTGTAMVHRPVPLPTDRAPQTGDRLYTWHVLLSGAFARSAIGQKLFGEDGPQAWLTQQAAPHLARIIFDSITRSFAHLELHGQNVDLLVDRRGQVVELFVKDLGDAALDIAAQVASGARPSPRLAETTLLATGDTQNVLTPEHSAARWYAAYLDQLRPKEGDPLGFVEAVVDGVKAQLLALLGEHTVNQFPESDVVYRAQHDWPPVYEQLGALRLLYVKAKLTEQFVPDARAASLMGEQAVAWAAADAERARRFNPDLSALSFGFVDDTPVAVRWGPPRGHRYDLGPEGPRVVQDFYVAVR